MSDIPNDGAEQPSEPKPERTEAQREASRRNGSNSRGATTLEGKARSSMNRLDHGGWARPSAIAAGPLQEDQDELDQQIDRYVNSLRPCDDATRRVAEDIAAVWVSLDRIERRESIALSVTKQPYDNMRSNAGLDPDRLIQLLDEERETAATYAAAVKALERGRNDLHTKDWLTLLKARALDLRYQDETIAKVNPSERWTVITDHLTKAYGSLQAGRAAWDRKSHHYPNRDKQRIGEEETARSPIHMEVLERLSNVKSRKYADLTRLFKLYEHLLERCPRPTPDPEDPDPEEAGEEAA